MDRTSAKAPLYLVRTTARPRRDLHAARDEQVRKAIALMHSDLSARWTVTTLARRVGLSRPAFARRFVAATGASPLKYLRRARMQHAARLLSESCFSLAQIGAQIGYGSEFAFNRAFKRVHHVAPGTFRRALRRSVPTLRTAA